MNMIIYAIVEMIMQPVPFHEKLTTYLLFIISLIFLHHHNYDICNTVQKFDPKNNVKTIHRRYSIQRRGPTMWNNILNIKRKIIICIFMLKKQDKHPGFSKLMNKCTSTLCINNTQKKQSICT